MWGTLVHAAYMFSMVAAPLAKGSGTSWLLTCLCLLDIITVQSSEHAECMGSSQSEHSEQWPSCRLQWNTAIIYCHCWKLAGLLQSVHDG